MLVPTEVLLDVDRYTPRPSKPMGEYTRNKNKQQGNILYHFSAFLSLEETKVAQLMRNFDINPEKEVSWGSMDIADNYMKDSSSQLGTPRPSPPLSPEPVRLLDRRRLSQSPALARPGRLSPATIEMILTANFSTMSGGSSAADTSYDSGLYQWLGVDPVPQSSPPLLSRSNKAFGVDTPNPDISIMSSRSAYSQPSLLPAHRRMPPLSPPATARPPFLETFPKEQPEASPSFSTDSDPLGRVNALLPPSRASSDDDSSTFPSLHDFLLPVLPKNISLQHYIPSTSVLRQFQRVIDELRGLYAPNDDGNNVPRWALTSKTSRRQIMLSTRSMPGSYPSPSSPCSPGGWSYPDTRATYDNHDQRLDLPMVGDRELRANQELYTEMAVMLFGQAAEEETQIKDLRLLADRLELLASKKRRVALILGARGVGKS